MLPGDGAGNFGTPIISQTRYMPYGLVLDLVMANRSIHSVSVSLDPVVRNMYEHLIISPGFAHWYSTETDTDGVLSIELIYQGDATLYVTNSVEVVIYGSPDDGFVDDGELVAESTYDQKAYDLDQQLGLQVHLTEGLAENVRGLGEKYLIDKNGDWYFILPNGEFYKWGGSLAGSILVEMFSSAYSADPSLLYNAQSPGVEPLN